MMYKGAIFYCFISIAIIVLAQRPSSPSDMLDVCIDGKYHKTKPGPEGLLYNQCTPWLSHACCTGNTTIGVHKLDLYHFNFSHCIATQEMSPKCLKHFIQDNCFYECSPYVGPWIVKVNRSWRKERFYGVPLCADECDRWYKDCKDDYTCTDNWAKNFDWKDTTCEGGVKCKTNFCPRDSMCRTFEQVYRNSTNFCQTVYDGSWKYTVDQPCMKMWFSGANPNKEVAELKANSLFSAGSKRGIDVITAVVVMILAIRAN